MLVSDIFTELQWRGLIHDHTEEVPAILAQEKITLYNGFDPTADSLHVGHLVPMVALARMQRFGHTPIALAGGGTGMVGDPSGRSAERNLLTNDEVDANVAAIEQQLRVLLDFEVRSNPARVVNNALWLRKLGMIEFLRDVGKHFTINQMLNRDSVKSRLEREDGLSYTEFSYMLLQAYDYLHLHESADCRLQTGGSDQWGNILSGVTLIRKRLGKTVSGLVYPLITRADGTKFGKSADGDSIWLSAARTSPYRFYQFFINFEDAKVDEGLRFYTFLSRDDIAELAHATQERPHERAAQKRLAAEVTRMVHGDTALARAEQASAVLFGGALDGLGSADSADIFADVPATTLPRTTLDGDGLPLTDLLVTTGLASSKGDARRAIQGGGINRNNERIADPGHAVKSADAIEGQFIVLRKGRREYHLVRLV
jgi:tyrosyl-tRNA synthetase